jgi:transposase InsO family protein
MMMRLQKYDAKVEYLQGKKMYLADTLSRAYLPTSTSKGPQDDIEHVHMTQYLPISDGRLAEIKTATEKDDVLQMLMKTILAGWPDDKQALPPPIAAFFSFRDELTVVDGIILRGERVVIPYDIRKMMKEKVHSSHLGISGCLRRARECLYWPNMTTEIRDFISQCSTCRELEKSNQKETLMSHDIPDRPWSKVGTDLCSQTNPSGIKEDYLVTVDYFSFFIEVDRLHNTTSKTVIGKLKQHFARYGLPEIVVSDNGPQYSSEEFAEFSRKWDFEHRTSSPGNSKANGKAEAAVKVAQALIRKTVKSGGDPLLALLDHRNTPTQELNDSPAQRSLGRRTRTLLPTTQKLLSPGYIDCEATKKSIQKRQAKQQEYYNKSAKDLPPLVEGDTVRLQPFTKGKKDWKKGTVVKRLDERSYDIETESRIYRRNRAHIKRTNEQPISTETQKIMPAYDPPPITDSENQQELPQRPLTPAKMKKTMKPTTPLARTKPQERRNDTPPRKCNNPQPILSDKTITTRSGRVVKRPTRFTEQGEG